MISDTLVEAVEEIDRYLTDAAFEGIYIGPMRERIVRLRAEMVATYRALDTPVLDLEQIVVQTGGQIVTKAGKA